MGFLSQAISFFLHIDKHLGDAIKQYGTGTYLLLFVIVFCETGLVFTPFLPGDSLLFAAGLFARLGSLDYATVALVLGLAALTGDNANYFAGKFLGRRLFRGTSGRFLKQENLDRTHAFFERYGGKTIILARFVPIVRTFAPFVAGMGAMTYRRFLAFSVAAATMWVGICVSAGYFFGSIPAVRRNFSLAVLAIVAISILPAVVEFIKHRREKAAREQAASASEEPAGE